MGGGGEGEAKTGALTAGGGDRYEGGVALAMVQRGSPAD